MQNHVPSTLLLMMKQNKEYQDLIFRESVTSKNNKVTFHKLMMMGSQKLIPKKLGYAPKLNSYDFDFLLVYFLINVYMHFI